MGAIVLLGRILNSCSYAIKGPDARIIGAIIGNYPFYIYMLTVFGFAVVNTVKTMF